MEKTREQKIVVTEVASFVCTDENGNPTPEVVTLPACLRADDSDRESYALDLKSEVYYSLKNACEENITVCNFKLQKLTAEASEAKAKFEEAEAAFIQRFKKSHNNDEPPFKDMDNFHKTMEFSVPYQEYIDVTTKIRATNKKLTRWNTRLEAVEKTGKASNNGKVPEKIDDASTLVRFQSYIVCDWNPWLFPPEVDNDDETKRKHHGFCHFHKGISELIQTGIVFNIEHNSGEYGSDNELSETVFNTVKEARAVMTDVSEGIMTSDSRVNTEYNLSKSVKPIIKMMSTLDSELAYSHKRGVYVESKKSSETAFKQVIATIYAFMFHVKADDKQKK